MNAQIAAVTPIMSKKQRTNFFALPILRGGGGAPVPTGGFGIATADTGAAQFPQNRAPSSLREPHRVQIGISVLQEFAKISLQPMARSCPCPSARPLLPGLNRNRRGCELYPCSQSLLRWRLSLAPR